MNKPYRPAHAGLFCMNDSTKELRDRAVLLSNQLNRLVLQGKQDSQEYTTTLYEFDKLALEIKYMRS